MKSEIFDKAIQLSNEDILTDDQVVKEYSKSKDFKSLDLETLYKGYRDILMSNHPSAGLEFLKSIDALPYYLKDLVGCYQREDYHPEGDVWNHTMLVVDIGALCKKYTDDPESFMWSCLLHDIGKPLVTTPQGHAPLHNEAGVKVFQDVKMIQSPRQREYIETMIMYHMHLMNMARNHSRDIKYLRLLKAIENKISLSDLMFISECDKLGRGRVTSQQYNEFLEYMNDKIERLGDRAPKPLVTSDDLGDVTQEVLDQAYEYQLQGYKKEKIIKMLKR